MTLVCILVLGLSGCGDTLTLNQYNTSEIWYIAYTDIDTVCESNELTADGSSILHSEEDYLLLSYVVDSNIEITKELKDACRMEHAVSDESFQKLKEHAMRGIAAQKIDNTFDNFPVKK